MPASIDHAESNSAIGVAPAGLIDCRHRRVTRHIVEQISVNFEEPVVQAPEPGCLGVADRSKLLHIVNRQASGTVKRHKT